MYTSFSFSALADLNQSISYFIDRFPLLLENLEHNDIVVKEWKERKKLSFFPARAGTGTAADAWNSGVDIMDSWRMIEIKYFTQTWGSTSCGWGGIGGAAMTESYTATIYNNRFGIIAVFWNGKPAYLVEDDKETMKCYSENNMPGLDRLDKLKVIFKFKQK